MKKLIQGLLIVTFMCFSIIGYPLGDTVKAATEGSDLSVDKFELWNADHASKITTVSKGVFNLDLTLSNSNKVNISDVFVLIDPEEKSSFSVTKGSAKVSVPVLVSESSTLTVPTISMIYDGGNNTKLPIKITYNKDKIEYEMNTYIWINATPDSSIKDPIPTDTSKYMPKLSVLSSTLPSGRPGDTLTIPLQIKNISYYQARNITVTPQFTEDTPLEVNALNPTQTISSLSSDSTWSVNFSLKIGSSAVNKVYPLKLKFEYENYNSDSYSSETTIYVKVTGTPSDPGSSKLVIKNFLSSAPTVVPGGTTDLSIDLSNEGNIYLKDIKISLLGLKEDGFTVVGSSTSSFFANLDAGQTTKVNFKLTASNKMTTGNYGISVKLEYKEGSSKETVADEQQFFIPVEGKDEPTNQTTKTVPKIILDQYSSNPTIVKAGQNLELNMTFFNTSETKAVRNIKIFLTANESTTEGGNIFTPVNSSNTFYIDSISPKGKVDKTLTLYAIPDAKQKTYTLTANLEYEDAEGTEYKATDLIGIPVTQDTKIETSEIVFPPEAYPYQPFPVSFDFYNTGKTMLRNLMIKTEGDFDLQNASYFVGNFDVGSSDHYEAMVIPRAAGQVQGAVVISFEDPTGQKTEIRKDFTMNVMDMPVMQDPGMDPGMNPEMPVEGGKKSIFTNPLVWSGAAVVVLAIIGLIVKKKIAKKREAMTLDE
jgi:hypothetical protein